jgi:hypothetical protein
MPGAVPATGPPGQGACEAPYIPCQRGASAQASRGAWQRRAPARKGPPSETPHGRRDPLLLLGTKRFPRRPQLLCVGRACSSMAIAPRNRGWRYRVHVDTRAARPSARGSVLGGSMIRGVTKSVRFVTLRQVGSGPRGRLRPPAWASPGPRSPLRPPSGRRAGSAPARLGRLRRPRPPAGSAPCGRPGAGGCASASTAGAPGGTPDPIIGWAEAPGRSNTRCHSRPPARRAPRHRSGRGWLALACRGRRTRPGRRRS